MEHFDFLEEVKSILVSQKGILDIAEFDGVIGDYKAHEDVFGELIKYSNRLCFNGDFLRSYALLKICLKMLRQFQIENEKLFLRIYNGLGIINFYLEKFELAIQFYHLALYISEGKSAVCYNNIADSLFRLSLYKDAKSYYELALAHLNSDYVKTVANAPVFYSNYCMCLIELNDLERAKIYFTLFKNAIQENAEKFAYLSFQQYQLESSFLFKEDKLVEAFEKLKTAREIAYGSSRVLDQILLDIEIAEILFSQNKLKESLDILEAILEVSDEKKINVYTKKILNMLVDIHRLSPSSKKLTELLLRYVDLEKNTNNDKFSTIITLVKEQKYQVDQLVLKNKLIDSQKRDLEQFTYIAAHDLQEPLRNILNFTDLFKLEKENDKRLKYADIVIDSTKRMSQFLSGILQYSIIGNEKFREEVDVNEIVGNIKIDIQTIIKAKQAQIICNNGLKIWGVKSEIFSLFLNLITNALKFSKKNVSPIVIIDCKKQNDFYLFSVKDNGIGIEMEYKDKIFEIFRRLHSRSEIKGSGIGLSLCKKIIDEHGGKIWIDSQKDEGTTVHFTMKVKNN